VKNIKALHRAAQAVLSIFSLTVALRNERKKLSILSCFFFLCVYMCLANGLTILICLRFVRQRKTFHAWLNFVRHRDEVADDVTEADGDVAAGTAAEKLQDACAPAAESNATSVIDVARVVGSNPDSESSVTGTASSSPCEKRSPVAAAKETKSAELSSGHKKLFDDISAVPCTVQTSPELKSEAVSPPVTPRPGSPGPAESPSVDDEATSVKQGGLVIVISEDEETASPKSDLDFASVTEPGWENQLIFMPLSNYEEE